MTTQQQRNRVRAYHVLLAACIVCSFSAVNLSAQDTVGSIQPYVSQTPHTYPTGNNSRPVVWSETAVASGAKFVMVHFGQFSLAAGDYVTVSTPDQNDVLTYTGSGPNNNGSFWSAPIQGDTAVIKLHAGPAVDYGYQIDKVANGTIDLGLQGTEQLGDEQPPSICGSIGWEDVACHLPNNLFQQGEDPVAILLFPNETANTVGQCTGWLIDSPMNTRTNNVLITNNHCVHGPGSVGDTFAFFHFQKIVCNGRFRLPVVRTRGVALLKTDRTLDYTLMTVAGNPRAQFGVITPTTKGFKVSDLMWIVQHPNGFTKKVGWFEDQAHTVRCTIQGIGGNGEAQYTCDTFGGSSGSPVEDPATAHALALHNLGAGGDCPPNLNSGNSFVNICADAGAGLLNCAKN